MSRVLILLFMGTLIASAQPAITPGGVVNAASFSPSGLPNSNIAQGSIFSIFGDRLGPDPGVAATQFPLPAGAPGLGGVRVRVNYGVQQFVDVPLLYVSTRQINALLPSSVPVGTANLVVTYDEPSQPAPINVVRSSFGVFSRSASGSGPGSLQNFVPPGSLPPNTIYQTAAPGQFGIIYGTGLGGVSNDDGTAPPPPDNHPEFGAVVYVGGIPVTPSFQGRSGCCAGLDQINFQIPLNVPQGCYIPVTVKTGSVMSNFTTISIASGGSTCTDSLSLSTTDLTRMQQVGTSSVGSVALERVAKNGAVTDTGAAWFGLYNRAQFENFRGLSGAPSLGTCTVYAFRGSNFKTADPISPVLLDAGQLRITRFDGAQQQMNAVNTLYSAQIGGGNLPAFLNPGIFTLDNPTSGPGQRVVQPFTTTVGVSEGLQWTDSPDSVSRDEDLTLHWTGGNPAQEYTQISGFALAGGAGATFVCSAAADALAFTVPAWVLAALPSGNGELRVGAVALPPTHRHTIPNISLDVLYASYSVVSSRVVSYH